MIGPFGIYLDEQTGLWQLFPLGDKKGGGGGPGLGTKSPRNVNAAPASPGIATRASREDHKHDVDTDGPVAVRGIENNEGTANSLARSDHEHRLELEVQSSGGLVGARPRLNFTGGVTVSDDAGGDAVDVEVFGVPSGLGLAQGFDDVPITGAGATYLTASFTVPDGFWDVEVYASATARLNYAGDASATPEVVSYALWVGGDALTSREVSIGSTAAIQTSQTLGAHAYTSLGPGTYSATLRASATLPGASTATMRWRYLGVRLFRATV